MDIDLFSRYARTLQDMSEAELVAEIDQPQRLVIEQDVIAGKRLTVVYAPFDYINPAAEIVIVGLTPGRQQMRNAIVEARRILRRGGGHGDAVLAAKVFASFSGPLRTNLVAMLDSVGVNSALGIQSTGSLWNKDAARVHFTSVLRYPVFLNGANYSGAPSMLTTPLLRKQLMTWFAREMASLPKAIFVPLGPKVAEAMEAIARQIGIDSRQVLAGMPHPSGANAERIAFFLGRKEREDLSRKVDADRIIAARMMLKSRVQHALSVPLRTSEASKTEFRSGNSI